MFLWKQVFYNLRVPTFPGSIAPLLPLLPVNPTSPLTSDTFPQALCSSKGTKLNESKKWELHAIFVLCFLKLKVHFSDRRFYHFNYIHLCFYQYLTESHILIPVIRPITASVRSWNLHSPFQRHQSGSTFHLLLGVPVRKAPKHQPTANN